MIIFFIRVQYELHMTENERMWKRVGRRPMVVQMELSENDKSAKALIPTHVDYTS